MSLNFKIFRRNLFLPLIIFRLFQMFSNSAWRVIAQENNHMVQSIANEHEVYRITKVYADEAHSWFPLVLVRADPIDSINATSWYFLRGSYSSVAELAEDFSFGRRIT